MMLFGIGYSNRKTHTFDDVIKCCHSCWIG